MSTYQYLSSLAQGNTAVRNKDYITAIGHYIRGLPFSRLAGTLVANIQIAQRKHRAQRALATKLHIAVLEPQQLSNNLKSRSQVITTLYRTFADVETIAIGQLMESHDTLSPLSNEATSRLIDFVAQSPFDVVHLTSPCPRQLLTGMLYKLVWDAKVLIDLDDGVLEAPQERLPRLTDTHLRERDFSATNAQEWSQIALALAHELDGITVSSAAVQQRFGGILIALTSDQENASKLRYAVDSAIHKPFAPALGRFCKAALPPLKPLIQLQESSGNRIKLKLTPLSQLEQDGGNDKYWKSLGEDPHFQLEFESITELQAGWYRIDLLIDASRPQNSAKFYLDHGQGYSEADTFLLPYQTEILATRVCFFSKPVRSARFDPKELKGRFRILALQWTRIDEGTAKRQILTQIAYGKGKSTPASLKQLRIDLERQVYEKKTSLSEVLARKYNELFIVAPGQASYEDWIENIEKPSLPSAGEIRTMLAEFEYRPLISVIMPTYNTGEEYLRACIDSVIAQSYPHWELCIADDASPKPHVRQLLEAYQAQDPRIKVVFRTENGHISHASNSALSLASGDFVALLDHDDALPEHALFFMAQAITQHPDAQIFYSDEDKLNAEGQRFDPHFKSDWNPDLFYSQNYVSHLGVYRRSLLERIGGFRAGVEGSQDQDLLLRCLLYVKGPQIVHIPRVLYHWRTVEGSTALASGEKSYTTEAGVKALTDYFAEAHPAVRVEPGQLPNTYRVRWPLPEPAPLVSLLIPTRDRRALTETCVRSILEKSTYTNYEILILDNGSVEAETLEFFEQIQREDRRVRVLRYDHPFNYSAINNFGVQHAHGEVIGLINNDIEVIAPEWLGEMVSHAMRPDIGCVGAKLYYSDDTIQHAGVILGIGGVANHSHKNFTRRTPGYFARLLCSQNYSAVTAACLLVRRSIYDKVNGLDEENLKVAFNDVDFCLKVRAAGYRNLWTPHAELYHHESVSRGAEDSPEKIKRFQSEVEFMVKKWGSELDQDPYYNPNLTKYKEDFSIKNY
ncbi:glycosyltransferase family 2 protein [Azotobacter chroococcum]|uniref:Glycosyl transferase, group 2 family protein n=1 Tax=Azotobacter chroococcum NCIMB 8003 TaxID=1328314 RepID=A0A0C4WNG0_9GAMM|nr:glycosyltransferase family 2 protein [Azotobacter chroococcum]AJE22089.1 Glycosyl transferase, group 2 family protein [Azotobacter chroococcum NCIMB 8003]